MTTQLADRFGVVNSDRGPLSDLNLNLHNSLGMELIVIYSAQPLKSW